MSLLADIRQGHKLRKGTIVRDRSAPHLTDSSEVARKYTTSILQTNMESWLPLLSGHSPETVFIPLSRDQATLITIAHNDALKREDAINSAASEYVMMGRVSSPLNPQEEILRTDLGGKLRSVMESFGGGCFAKLSSRSPKDAAILSGAFERCYRDSVSYLDVTDENLKVKILSEIEGACLKFVNPEEVIRALILSDRVSQDILFADERESWGLNIVVREWRPVPIEMEFRAFVSNKRITAISQYAYEFCSPDLNVPAYLALTVKKIRQLFEDSIKPILDKHSFEEYVIDFGVKPGGQEGGDDWGVFVIELNPFAETTDAALFSWTQDSAILNGTAEGVEFPVLRITKEPRKGALQKLPQRWKKVIERVDKEHRTSVF
ncbi:hypothetical protein BT69DRAFT_985412 [Atractiella rhizophila]|nr:hypothetical protein BT69DRAFT_985412 [Atractiella rhizophila]